MIMTVCQHRIVAVTVFCLGFLSMAMGQRFGGNPNGLKFKSLQGKYVDVLHPESQSGAAKRVRELTTLLAAEKQYSLGDAVRKIPIVLQTLPLVSNAYVGLGPWRSEFYLTPLQNALQLGSTSWVDNLAVHEYRHVQQYSNFRHGLSKFAYLLAGEQGQALANAASIPDWFFEGDAVFTETRFLNQGRGRLPGFMDPFRSLWLAKRQYPFQKLRSGSLKDVVPNHYELGYLLVAYGYGRFGQDFWGKVTQDAARFKGLVYPFQKAVKRHSGLTYKAFVNQAIDSFRLSGPLADIPVGMNAVTQNSDRLVTDHLFPVWVGGDSILALQKAYNRLPQWTIYHLGKSMPLGVKAIGIDDYFNYKRGYVVYTGYSPDTRWSWREYSDVYLFNIYDKSTRRLTHRKRFFSPDMSHTGEQLAAVAVGPGGNSELVVFPVDKSQQERVLPNPKGYFYSYPQFSGDDQTLFAIARKPDGTSGIVSINLSDSQEKIILPFVNAPLAFLRLTNGKLIFSVSQGNRNQLWAHDLQTGKHGPLADGYTGVYVGDLREGDEQLVFSTPTADGEQLFSKSASTWTSRELTDLIPVMGGDSSIPVATDVAASKYKHRWPNIHSWRPFYEQPEWSFTLYGEDVLNKWRSSYTYAYNENEGSHRIGAELGYGGFFPWINGGTNYTANRTFRDSTRSLQWNEWTGNIGLQLPLNFTGGKLYRNLDLQFRMNGVSLDYINKNNVTPRDRFVTYALQQLTWSMQTQKAVQHIYPRFALAARVLNRFAVGNTSAQQTLLLTQLYLPGIFRNHALVLGAGYQSRDTLGQYNFSNNFAMARGYQTFNYPRMWRYSVNYHLPLIYPDWGVGNIVYFQRVRANLFYDNMNLKSLRTRRVFQLSSAGTEIYFDTKWWNQQAVSFGFRYSRLLDTQIFTQKPNPNRFEFIMPLNLLPD
ncbi:MAG: hypothetical protein RLZZ172_1323 [Bacteroidota bacterium]|jgi:hypothetical protein